MHDKIAHNYRPTLSEICTRTLEIQLVANSTMGESLQRDFPFY